MTPTAGWSGVIRRCAATLNLNSAPSWKPLPFLFTLPYSLLGKQTAFWLWVYTAVAAGFRGAGVRRALRLLARARARRAALAGAGGRA